MKKHVRGYTVVSYVVGIFFVLISNACSYSGYATTSVSKNSNIIATKYYNNNYNNINSNTSKKTTSYTNYISPYSRLYNDNNCSRNINCKCDKH